jgi:cytochrome c553
VTPGIYQDWKNSRHAKTKPVEALKKDKLERRISSSTIPEPYGASVIGCAECHTMNSDKHKDAFEHNGFKIHVVVTPNDCATCHGVESKQYSLNIMSRAYGNLAGNPLYRGLTEMVNGPKTLKEGRIIHTPPDWETQADSCFHCHGTRVEVKGLKKKDTPMGEMEFPVLAGWPNQGVGRINPDNSLGSCASCHTRHAFSIEMARKPYTCSQCHKGPDVPAYKVYEVSKHGNIFSSQGKDWDMKGVPWKVGKDFTGPTCAACHVSLLTNPDGEVIAERTHQMNDRLSWRLMGLIYAHPHPKSPDTTLIKNRAGLPLPTELTGEPVSAYLIDPKEQARRRQTMEKVCQSCHSQAWVAGHFRRLENTIKTTNQFTLTATQLMMSAWDKGLAKGPAQKDSPFNEALERKWAEQWLFYANSTRYASAMVGADYGAFAEGRWYLTKNIQEMAEWIELKAGSKKR